MQSPRRSPSLRTFDWRWLFGLGLFVSLFLAGTVSQVEAHTILMVRSDPEPDAVLAQPPSSVYAWFNEELETDQSWIRVAAPDGRPVDDGSGGVDLDDADHASMVAHLEGSLTDGQYLVSWHAVVFDGDSAGGEFTFWVGEGPAGSTQPPPGSTDPELLSTGLFALLAVVAGGAIMGSMIIGRRRSPQDNSS